ncbi:MAG: hypothetical protein R2711_18995 [Acidimicrobiales bacterium]
MHAGACSAYRDRRFGAPPTTSSRGASSSSPRTTTRWATGPPATACRTRPLAALLTLLGSATPMLFQGEELDEDAPFAFFTDPATRSSPTPPGRAASEFADWAAEAHEEVPDPQDPATFARSKLTWRDDERARAALARYRRMIELRAEVPRIDAEVTYDEESALGAGRPRPLVAGRVVLSGAGDRAVPRWRGGLRHPPPGARGGRSGGRDRPAPPGRWCTRSRRSKAAILPPAGPPTSASPSGDTTSPPYHAQLGISL